MSNFPTKISHLGTSFLFMHHTLTSLILQHIWLFPHHFPFILPIYELAYWGTKFKKSKPLAADILLSSFNFSFCA